MLIWLKIQTKVSRRLAAGKEAVKVALHPVPDHPSQATSCLRLRLSSK